MNNKNLTRLLAILFAFSLFSCSTKEKKVLIIGIDGCRPDILDQTNTPNIDKLVNNGSYTYQSQTDPISSSGICWTGMLTGVWHEKHNVISNSYTNPNIKEYPHFFHRVKEQMPTKQIYSIAHWAPVHKILQEGDADYIKTYSSDDAVTDDVVKQLKTADVDVMFVHLDDVDHAGHGHGYHPDTIPYVESIENSDVRVGKILTALESRENYKNEDWVILVSTDHGGSGTGHGQDIPLHTTTFVIVSGDNTVKGEMKKPVNVVDIAVTAMSHLGVDIKPEWKLDGKAVGLKQ